MTSFVRASCTCFMSIVSSLISTRVLIMASFLLFPGMFLFLLGSFFLFACFSLSFSSWTFFLAWRGLINNTCFLSQIWNQLRNKLKKHTDGDKLQINYWIEGYDFLDLWWVFCYIYPELNLAPEWQPERGTCRSTLTGQGPPCIAERMYPKNLLAQMKVGEERFNQNVPSFFSRLAQWVMGGRGEPEALLNQSPYMSKHKTMEMQSPFSPQYLSLDV